MLKKVTFKGSPLTLVGRSLRESMPAPNFQVFSVDLQPISLDNFSDKIKVITTFLSLDTPVCDSQVKEFNKRASEISPEIVVLGISKDLPFAQKRFCQTNEIKNAKILSDYKTSSFGINYGLLIKETNLLARAVLAVDKSNILRYFRIVEELTNPPDYAEALKNLQQIVKIPSSPVKQELPAKCTPCEGNVSALTKERVQDLLIQCGGWELVEDKKLVKKFKFKDFMEAKYFLDLIAIIAEEEGHHPGLALDYNRLKVTLTTHAAGGLTENDFIMARIIDEIGG